MNTPSPRVAALFAPFLAALFAGLLFAFWWTRAHTATALGLDTLPLAAMRIRALVSGALSDVWIAACLALLVSGLLWLGCSPLASWKRRSAALACTFVLLVFSSVGLGLLLGTHVPYVEFFGTILSWQHLRYLGDEGFLRASADTLLASEVVWCGAGAGVVAATTWFALLPFTLGARGVRFHRVFVAFPVLLLALGAGAQIFKVRANTLSWGWKVPPVLKLNFLENAAIQWWRAEKMPAPTEADLRLLKEHAENVLGAKAVPAGLKGSLEGGFLPSAPGSVGDVLKSVVQHRILAREPVYVFVLVLESFRPEESKLYSPTLEESSTPALDALAQEAVVFDNVFTTGGVTRGGQEALLCGLLSGELTSAMRDIPSATPRCLPRLLKDALGEENVHAAWWHGGDFNFDSQGTFWKRQGMDTLLSREDFFSEPGADTLPGTWWGVSDFTLVERVKLRLLDAKPSARVFLHTYLSVTNHPSWGLPVDAPFAWYKGDAERWNRFKPLLTTRYTDEALNRLVAHLKETVCYLCQSGSLWDNAIVMISNDHGTLMPSPLRPEGYAWGLSAEGDAQAVRAASHATFLLSGGLVQASLRGLGLTGMHRMSSLQSQLDAFATLADVFGLGPEQGVRTVGDSLFASTRRWPVVVDLGNRVAFPHSGKETTVWDRANLLKQGLTAGDASEGVLRAAYFRGVQSLLARGQSGH